LTSTRSKLVAKEYTQKVDKYFFDTYSLITGMTMICVPLLFATSCGLLIHQMNVKTTFFNGKLDEKIYMNQTEGFAISRQEDNVCKLLKSLYGLKQTPK
jgi:hypothetical protein